MSRSKLGPLALESPLGTGSSSVFRAVHLQQKHQVAVRIFATPIGMTPEAKRSFAEEMEALKGLKHLHVVRCFGGGFDKQDAYLVHELIDGSSLDQLLSRRGRLAWEQVLEYGIQLANALQYAHDRQWIHGRIRPDKILVGVDESTVKLNDFRREIHAAEDTTLRDPALFAYAAPESFDGKTRLQPSSDLYSLGAVMYHAITGRAPFEGGNASHIKNQIKETPVAPVASLVFDTPVWLSAIVEQLLDKNPQRRPFSAAAVAKALLTAKENALAGISVAEHLTSGFSPLQLNHDREAAEKALGIKKQKVKKLRSASHGPITDQPWFLVTGIVLAIGAIYFFTRPLSEAKLRQRAEALLAKPELEYHYQARDQYLSELLARFPNGENSTWAVEQVDFVDMEEAERRMDRNRRFNRDPSSEGERRYEEAQRLERFGDPITALEKYRAIAELMKDEPTEKPFVNLSKRQIERLEAKPQKDMAVRKLLQTKLDEASKHASTGSIAAAREIWRSITTLYDGNQEYAEFVIEAQKKLE